MALGRPWSANGECECRKKVFQALGRRFSGGHMGLLASIQVSAWQNRLLPSPCTAREHNIDPRPLPERVSNGAPPRAFAASASGRRGAPPTCFLSLVASTVRKTPSFRLFAMDGMAESRRSRRCPRRKAGHGFSGTRSSRCLGPRKGATWTGSATAAAGWTPPRRPAATRDQRPAPCPAFSMCLESRSPEVQAANARCQRRSPGLRRIAAHGRSRHREERRARTGGRTKSQGG